MSHSPAFLPGDRVRMSPLGIERHPRAKYRTGVVVRMVRADRRNEGHPPAAVISRAPFGITSHWFTKLWELDPTKSQPNHVDPAIAAHLEIIRHTLTGQ